MGRTFIIGSGPSKSKFADVELRDDDVVISCHCKLDSIPQGTSLICSSDWDFRTSERLHERLQDAGYPIIFGLPYGDCPTSIPYCHNGRRRKFALDHIPEERKQNVTFIDCPSAFTVLSGLFAIYYCQEILGASEIYCYGMSQTDQLINTITRGLCAYLKRNIHCSLIFK